jgi:hypothetical protein
MTGRIIREIRRKFKKNFVSGDLRKVRRTNCLIKFSNTVMDLVLTSKP